MRTQVGSHIEFTSLGKCGAMFCERSIMWFIQSFIIATKILPFILRSIQSSVFRTSSLGSAQCKYKQQVQTTLMGLLLIATKVNGLALEPMIDMEDMLSLLEIL